MAGQGSEIAGAAGGPSAATLAVVDLLRSRAANPVTDADPPLAAGTVIDGRYRVLREIGAGGMGRVYEAEHMFLRRPMALKLLRRGLATAPEATARLIQEAMLAGQVPHSAVVRVFDCAALADGQVYLAMELLRGESLEQRLRRPGSAAEVVPLLAELARGLAAVHRVGVVHRDIKPANVFLADSEMGVQAKLLDFGVAKLLPGATAEAAVRTQAGAVLGTPYYLAPEQARGGVIDGRADLYALGVMLYETLTGTLPFLGDSFMAILARHLHEVPLDPRQAAPERGIPDGVALLTMRLLSKEPGLRAADGDALADELTGLMASEGAALRGVLLGGSGGAAVAGATTVAPAIELVEGTGEAAGGSGAATRRVPVELAEGTGAATRRVPVELAEGTGAATRRVQVELAEGTGEATRRVQVELAEGTGAATRRVPVELAEGTGAATRRVPVELAEGTGAATRGAQRRWLGRWLGLGAALGLLVVGIGWSAARTMREGSAAGAGGERSGPIGPGDVEVTPVAAPVAEVGASTRAVAGGTTGAAETGEGQPARPEVPRPVTEVTKAKRPVGGTSGAAKKPRPGQKKPSEGGTTRTPPPKTGGDPPLKPDVYDL